MVEDHSTQTAEIRALNDKVRTSLPYHNIEKSRLLLTQGIQGLVKGPAHANEFLPALLTSIREFDDFTKDNDPYGEHDFGAVEFRGERIFWKIDYYAPDMERGSEDPADPTKTMRVLTIMLAHEY